MSSSTAKTQKAAADKAGDKDDAKSAATTTPDDPKSQGSDKQPSGAASSDSSAPPEGDAEDKQEAAEQEAVRAAAAEQAAAEERGDGAVTNESAQGGVAGVVGGAEAGRSDSGPMTGVDAPAESAPRMPSTIVSDNDSNPLEPPTDHRLQTLPEQGHNLSSTDHVYAATGGRTVAGEDFSAFVNEDGQRLRADSIFEDPDETKTFMIVKQRVLEQFYYPNTTEVCTRVALVEGQRVSRQQAAQITAALESAPTPLAEV